MNSSRLKKIIERIIFVQVCLRNLQSWLLILLRVREKSLLNDIKQLWKRKALFEKLLVPGCNVMSMGRAVHCMTKIGDEVYMEPSLGLRTHPSMYLSLHFWRKDNFCSGLLSYNCGTSFFSSIETNWLWRRRSVRWWWDATLSTFAEDLSSRGQGIVGSWEWD